MKICMYGATICKDCVAVKEQLTKRGMEFEYKDICSSTAIMKEFLSYRDQEKIFEEIKQAGKIGIPFFIVNDTEKTLDISEFVEIESYNTGSACSLDGKNC